MSLVGGNGKGRKYCSVKSELPSGSRFLSKGFIFYIQQQINIWVRGSRRKLATLWRPASIGRILPCWEQGFLVGFVVLGWVFNAPIPAAFFPKRSLQWKKGFIYTRVTTHLQDVSLWKHHRSAFPELPSSPEQLSNKEKKGVWCRSLICDIGHLLCTFKCWENCERTRFGPRFSS